MVDPEHGKSLTPKHVRLDEYELDRMRPETLAAIMAKWPAPASTWFRLKYSCHEHLRPVIFGWLCKQIQAQALEEDWPMGTTRRLVDLAIDEYTATGTCGRCGGNGRILRHRGPGESCRECSGTGRAKLSQRRRADKIGVNQATWGRTWARRYTALIDRMEWLESVIATYR